jgi:hypothetical protein
MSDELRITRQYADALTFDPGYALITRQYVEVLQSSSIFPETVTDTLSLVQTEVDKAPRYATVNDIISFTDAELDQGPRPAFAQHNLNIFDSHTVHQSTIHVSVTDTLPFAHKGGRVYNVSVNHTLVFIPMGARIMTANNILTFIETISGGQGKDIEDTLVLVQSIITQSTLNKLIIDTLLLTHSGTYQLEGPSCIQHNYTPFVGFSTDTETTPPDIVVPTLGTATMTLTYPYVSPTTTLVLRNPQFSNKDTLNFNRINRQTRGGALIVYANSIWPKIQILQVEVRWLKPAQLASYLTFLGLSLGQEIGLLDHENRQWRGIITKPDTPVSNPENKDLTISFEFEGELV